MKESNQKGKIKAISISQEKGVKKINVAQAILKKDFGFLGDAHAGSLRQVSFLAQESIDKILSKGLKVKAGDFAENITTAGIDLKSFKIGARLKVGKGVLEITQIGKVCHARCNIYYQVGDCVMPREGIFARVVKGGVIKPGDTVEIIKNV